MAVSYTHLDVYKGQQGGRPLLAEGSAEHAHQHEDDDDDEHDAEDTGGVSSPGAGVGPGRYGADQQQDQQYDDDRAQSHGGCS